MLGKSAPAAPPSFRTRHLNSAVAEFSNLKSKSDVSDLDRAARAGNPFHDPAPRGSARCTRPLRSLLQNRCSVWLPTRTGMDRPVKPANDGGGICRNGAQPQLVASLDEKLRESRSAAAEDQARRPTGGCIKNLWESRVRCLIASDRQGVAY